MKKNNQKNIKLSVAITLIIASTYLFITDSKLLAEKSFPFRMKGKILIQVEENGEAWYISPKDNLRYYMGRPKDAFEIMRSLGVGISNEDLAKIKIAEANFTGDDSDNDGLPDRIETSLGTDPKKADTDNDGYTDRDEILNDYSPLGPSRMQIDKDFSKTVAGKIVLQVERNGEAWYVNPENNLRYYLGKPEDAFEIMRSLGLGITNQNLAQIPKFDDNSEYNGQNIEKEFVQNSGDENLGKKYTDPTNKFSLNYPEDWKVKKYEYNPEITQITDSYRDFIEEKRAVITINYFESSSEFPVDEFDMGDKLPSKTLTRTEKTINEHEVFENSYEHKLAYEKTTTIKIAPTKFVIITLTTAKHNNSYYETIYSELLESLEF